MRATASLAVAALLLPATGYASFGADVASHAAGGPSGGAPPSALDWLCCLVFGTVPLVALAAIAFGVLRLLVSVVRRLSDAARPGAAHLESFDVSSIRIALDRHVRPELARKLDAMAARGDSRTKADLLRALHEICVELRRLETAWVFAQVANAPVANEPYTEKAFRRIVDDSRARFRVETVRVSGSGAPAEHIEGRHDAVEAAGVVVLTVVVAAKREIVDIHDPTDARALHELLAAFGAMKAHELVALEIIWSPSAEDDFLTDDELHRLYPELHRVRDATLQSRVHCAVCSAPFWASLSHCPYCGAPAIDARHGAASSAPRFRGGS